MTGPTPVITRIQDELGLTGLAHLTCVGSTAEEIGAVVDRLEAAGVRNVLALRGDAPDGAEQFEATAGGFANATDLIGFLNEKHDVCIGAACYPEAHPEATSAEDDLRFARMKQDLGASFLTTQLFFDCDLYWAFVERAPRGWDHDPDRAWHHAGDQRRPRCSASPRCAARRCRRSCWGACAR